MSAMGLNEKRNKRTFPNPCPENISVVNVHHNPLVIERVFIDRARRGVGNVEHIL